MQNTDIKNHKRVHRRIGIKWKMVAILLCFVFVFALSIWVFQIRMLNFFYQNAKFNELEKTADALSDELSKTDDVYRIAHLYATEYYNDIWVYEIKGGVIDHNRPLVYADGTREALGPFLENKFNELYERTTKNDGKYTAVVPMKNFKESYEVLKKNNV